jgi:poly-beta-1,6-N-acetyl-D-glucosamine synthase
MLFRWTIAWILYPGPQTVTNRFPCDKVTVIVAARNESQVIINCLKSLQNQDFPSEKYEIIISDDFSEDTTCEVVRNFIATCTSTSPHFRLITAPAGSGTGKKSALLRAIMASTGQLILVTDADCTMGDNWVKSFADCYQFTNASMITGFVRLSPLKNTFEKLQALEFLSLSGSGAASVIMGSPLMCNGANLAFTKEAFNRIQGYTYGRNIASGDDTFLMLQMAKSGKDKVVFNNNPQSIVTSLPVDNFSKFISQRRRWASKVQNYNEGYIKRTGVFLFMINTLLVLVVLSGLLNVLAGNQVALVWFIKIMADFLFLYPVCRFSNQQNLLLLFLPAVILYPVYALAGLFSSSGKSGYIWKGRNYYSSYHKNEQ